MTPEVILHPNQQTIDHQASHNVAVVINEAVNSILAPLAELRDLEQTYLIVSWQGRSPHH